MCEYENKRKKREKQEREKSCPDRDPRDLISTADRIYGSGGMYGAVRSHQLWQGFRYRSKKQ